MRREVRHASLTGSRGHWIEHRTSEGRTTIKLSSFAGFAVGDPVRILGFYSNRKRYHVKNVISDGLYEISETRRPSRGYARHLRRKKLAAASPAPKDTKQE